MYGYVELHRSQLVQECRRTTAAGSRDCQIDYPPRALCHESPRDGGLDGVILRQLVNPRLGDQRGRCHQPDWQFCQEASKYSVRPLEEEY